MFSARTEMTQAYPTTDVEGLITEHRRKLALSPPGHPERPMNLNLAGTQLCASFLLSGNSAALEDALRYSREIMSLPHISTPFTAVSLNLLGTCLLERFKLHEHAPELNEGIKCHLRVLPLRPKGHPDRWHTLISLAEGFLMRFETVRRMEDLVKGIVCGRGALTCCPSVLEVRLKVYDNVAFSSYSRFQLLGQGHDIADAVEITRRALALTQPGHDSRPSILERYTHYLDLHFLHFGQVKYFDEAEAYCREFTRLCPVGHSYHARASQALGCHLLNRYSLQKTPILLDEGIPLCETALQFLPPGDANRHAPLKALAVATRLRFELRKEAVDIERSIAYGKEALALCLSGSNPRDAGGPLHGLGMSYTVRFEHFGRIDDLEEALRYCRRATPLLGFSAFLTLGNMLTIYRHRYYCLQDPNDLVEGGKCGVEAVRMSPQGDPGKFITLNSLAGIMNDRFVYSGKLEYLEEGISYCRQSISACPAGHPDGALPMLNLAGVLSTRFEILGEKRDMEESIVMAEFALSGCPPGHPSRERCLRVLVLSSKRFWTHTGVVLHLDRAIQYARDALPLHSVGHFDYPRSREYLAVVLHDRFLQTGQLSDLQEAIQLHHEALVHCSEGSWDHGMLLSNLASALSANFDISNERTDLDAALEHYALADKTISMEDPMKPILHSGMALAYLKIVPLTEAIISTAFGLFESAASNPYAGSHTQFEAASKWCSAARAHNHSSTVDAFSRLLTVLQLRLLTKESVEAQQEFLREIPFRQLSSDAAAAALESGRLDTAVELLEQGRTMLWSRMRGYRHPIADLRGVNVSLAERFKAASAQLERTSLALKQPSNMLTSISMVASVFFFDPKSVSVGPEPAATDNKLRRHRLLSQEWKRILDEIRQTAGFADFLRTPSFGTLKTAAQEGPIILVNVSVARCDAIIVHINGPPHLIPLPDASPALFDSLTIRLQDALGSERNRRPKGLVVVLRELWRAVVHPVVEELNSLGIEPKSRIWWCPTGQLCALPLHAAGPFTPGQRNLPDFFVSSYTPTITSLMNAREAASPASTRPRVLVIGQPETLPMVEKEVFEVQQIGDTVDVLLGPAATATTVISNLRTHPWTHFACHGHRHPEPFKSAFEVHNGERITVLDIARADLPHAEFAFLSACHAAAPDLGTPDEFITLAAALQFAGFRGVVSTLWEMADEDGPQVSRDFYTHMFRGGASSDARKAAVALNSAVRLMRKNNVPLQRWVNFIHIGI
ncbi:CHAT domain-containing protein [Mycena vulgaris]|nr:CHAT domain-containing protein [Mycena vulgaris]